MTQKEKWAIQNIIFGLLGGWIFGAIWYLIGLFWHLTYIGRPVAKCCFLIARFAVKPYGRVIATTGDYDFFWNIVWMILIGAPWMFVFLFMAGVCALTLIGVPFAMTYLRLVGLVAAPVGMQLERRLEDWEWK